MYLYTLILTDKLKQMKQHEHIQYIVNNAIKNIDWVYPSDTLKNVEFDFEYLKEKYTLAFDVIIKDDVIDVTDVIIWQDVIPVNITSKQEFKIIEQIKQNC